MSDRTQRRASRIGTLTSASLALVGLGAVAFMSSTVTAGGNVESAGFEITVSSPDAVDGVLHFGDEPLEPVAVDDPGSPSKEDLLGRADRAATATVSVTSAWTGPATALLSGLTLTDRPTGDGPATEQAADLWLMICNAGLRTVAQCTEPVNLADLAAAPRNHDFGTAPSGFHTTLRPDVDAFDLNVWLIDGGVDHSATVTDVELGFEAWTGQSIRTLPEPYPEAPYAPAAEVAILAADLGLGDGLVAAFDLAVESSDAVGLNDAGQLLLSNDEVAELTGTVWATGDDGQLGTTTWLLVDDQIDLAIETLDESGELERILTIQDVPVANGTFAVDLDGLDETARGVLDDLAATGTAVHLAVLRGDARSDHVGAKDGQFATVDRDDLDGLARLLDLADGVDAGANACLDEAVAPMCREAGNDLAQLADGSERPATAVLLAAKDHEAAAQPTSEPTSDPASSDEGQGDAA